VSRPADGADEPLTIVLLASANSVHTSGWAAALGRAGHRVVVASLQPSAAIPGAELRVAPAKAAKPVVRLPLAARWLRRLVRDVQPDVVHVLSLGTYGLLSLALPGNTARVLNPYGGEFRAARRSRTRAAILRQVLRRGDMVLPVSAEIRAEILHHYAIPAQRVRVLSWGVSEELIEAQPRIDPAAVRAAVGIPAEATTVLSVRTTSSTYRTLEIVSAFAQAAAGRPDLFLIVLSGARVDSQPARLAQGAYLERVREAARLMLDRIVVMERTLSRDETFSLMCASDVVVSVPPEDQHSFSVLEAALAGPQILLSDIPPNRQMTDDGLAADLLKEPITDVLAQALRAVRPDESARFRNRQYILSNEHGGKRLVEHERLFRSLSGRT
jgi:glycosyltransferase involved in cell wall biosynthesis